MTLPTSRIDDLLRMGRSGEWEKVRESIRSCADISTATDSLGTPILTSFARLGDMGTVDLLISMGADVNEISDEGLTPLLACIYGAMEGFQTGSAMEILLLRGAEPNKYAYLGHTAVHSAAHHRLAAHAESLLKHGGDPELKTCNEFAETASQIARRTKSHQIMSVFARWNRLGPS